MKVDTNKLDSKINWICSDCGKAALRLPENKGKRQFDLSTWHIGECDACHKGGNVTQTRDFMFPVVEVKNSK